MRKKFFTTAAIMTVMMLTGCGANSNIDTTVADLENYAYKHENITFTDVTDDYKNIDYIEALGIVETADVHIELWDMDGTVSAASWFKNNSADLEEQSNGYAGSTDDDSGDYSYSIDGEYYRLIYAKDKGVYAYGTKTEVNKLLKNLNIIEK